MKVGWLPLSSLAVVAGCKSLPEGRVGVADIRIRGSHEVAASDLRNRIATREAPKFLGLFRAGWRRYEEFEPEVLEKDLQRIEHYYERRGYYETKVRAGRVLREGEFVDVEILVEESEPVLVRSVLIAGLENRPFALVVRVKSGILLEPRDVFDQEKLDLSTRNMTAILANRGYAYAKVVPHAVVDLVPRSADVSFRIDSGVECKVGPIVFEGVGDLPESMVRSTFGADEGDRYSAEDLETGRRALVNLGVFASVDVIPDLSDPTRANVPIRVVVTRSSLRGVRLGAGFLIDVTRTDVHGLIAWDHRNLLGRMRHFTVEDRPSLVFFPTALSEFDVPRRILPANALATTLSQPAFPEGRTTTSVRLELNNYPIILSPVSPNQEVFPGYHELRGVLGLQRFFASLNFRGSTLYNFQANLPFAYAGEINPAFGRVVVSYVDLRGQFDLRDDPIRPRQGYLLQSSVQFAGGILGGNADDVRIRPEMRMYFPVSSTVTLAAKGVLGLVFPRNYGATLGTNFLAIPSTEAALPYISDLQLTYFRGFFSGGADSNRGYGYRAIGPHGVNPLVIPGTLEQVQARCDPASPLYDERLCLVATGGLSLWEASIELRAPVYGDLGVVLFVDASDVSSQKMDIRLQVPHLSVGFGIRYATPVGPLRVDVGFRIPGLQRIGGTLDPVRDGPTPDPFLGIPAALSIGLGEAY